MSDFKPGEIVCAVVQSIDAPLPFHTAIRPRLGKAYKATIIEKQNPSIGYTFNIPSELTEDNGSLCYCLEHGCGFLSGGEWRLLPYEEWESYDPDKYEYE